MIAAAIDASSAAGTARLATTMSDRTAGRPASHATRRKGRSSTKPQSAHPDTPITQNPSRSTTGSRQVPKGPASAMNAAATITIAKQNW